MLGLPFRIDPHTGCPRIDWAAPKGGRINHAWVTRSSGEKVALCDRAGQWGAGNAGWTGRSCAICERKVREGEWPR